MKYKFDGMDWIIVSDEGVWRRRQEDAHQKILKIIVKNYWLLINISLAKWFFYLVPED